MDTLDRLRADVQRDPQRVAGAASEIVLEARASGDLIRLSRSLGVLGRARRALGDIALAESDLLAAVEAGCRAADDELAADAHVGLAGVLVFAGRSEDALAHLATADRLGSERVRAYAALQRAFVARKTGHPTEALAGFAAALPTLRRLGARLDIAMLLLNTGAIRTQAGDFDLALAEFTEAGELFEQEESGYGVAQARHGVGWVYARRGDVVRALDHLDQAADLFAALGYQGREVDVDRVEVLLAAGLASWGAELAAETARRAAAAGDHISAAEMWLMCARAALLDGDRDRGARLAERARVLFAAQSSVAWEHVARLEIARAGVTGVDPDELCSIAADLDRAGHARGAATAVALAALAACRTGSVERATALAADCADRSRRLGVFEVRIFAEHAQAECALARADRRGARRHVRTGLAELRRHRSTFAAADARASVAVHAEALAALGLRIALAGGSARDVLRWIELARAGRRRHPAARPLIDPEAAAELAELRSIAGDVRAGEAEGRDTADLLRRQRDLEQSAHRRRLRTGDSQLEDSWEPPDVAALRSMLDGRQLVELAMIDERVVAVTVGVTRSRLVDLGPANQVLDPIGALTAALRTAISPGLPAPRRRAAVDLIGRAAARLDTLLGDALHGDGPVVLVVPASLHAVPWQLLPVLSGRPVVVAPSATWWSEHTWGEEGGRLVDEEPDRMTVAIAGPRLLEAEREARDVAACYPSAVVLTGPSATISAVSQALATATTAHVASHGHVRRDNALWSSLELADGPLCVYDLEALPRTPNTVVLSGCETGVGVRAGDGLLGLSTALLERGTTALVASVCLLPDSGGTRSLMAAMHGLLAAGAPPSVALARLSAGPLGDEPTILAASLTCFGTG